MAKAPHYHLCSFFLQYFQKMQEADSWGDGWGRFPRRRTEEEGIMSRRYRIMVMAGWSGHGNGRWAKWLGVGSTIQPLQFGMLLVNAQFINATDRRPEGEVLVFKTGQGSISQQWGPPWSMLFLCTHPTSDKFTRSVWVGVFLPYLEPSSSCM